MSLTHLRFPPTLIVTSKSFPTTPLPIIKLTHQMKPLFKTKTHENQYTFFTIIISGDGNETVG
ncbi:hypothetical protein HanPI659440_Chr02g0046291 [Helianthus annuus]|nr:hypothetical protein HanHA89_Chr02g0054271 [Helianthus annuus]KAJ0805138.1 hypothetical protein HanPI659440_Chr02g0046291 [Helianthus annuus]